MSMAKHPSVGRRRFLQAGAPTLGGAAYGTQVDAVAGYTGEQVL
jgi:hypothetical protein